MSIALLPNQLSNALLQVRLALGADLTADPTTWVYTDITTDVSQANNGGVTIAPMGRSNESSVAQPAGCSMRLKNPTGAYTPYNPVSSNFPNIRLGTPVQVRVSLDGGSTWSIRFQGEASAWTPGWDAQGRSAYVVLTASGITRRLGSRSKSVKSAAYREFSQSSPTRYWALEEGFAADRISVEGSTGSSAPALQLRASTSLPVVLGGVSPQPGCGPMPNFAAGGSLSFPLAGTSTTAWTVEFALNFGAGEPSIDSYSSSGAQINVFEVFNTTAATGWTRWEFEVAPHNSTYTNGRLILQRFDQGTSDFDLAVDEDLPSDFNPWDGLNHHIGLRLAKNGGSVDWYLYVDGAQYRNGTLARAYTIADNAVVNGAPWISTQMPFGIGHVTFHDGAYTPPASHGQAVQGWAGEDAIDRLVRLCGEEGVALTVVT